ncbi:MAG: hypothetical protein RRY55_01230 [Bacteroidales bacterium]
MSFKYQRPNSRTIEARAVEVRRSGHPPSDRLGIGGKYTFNNSFTKQNTKKNDTGTMERQTASKRR